MSNESCPNCGYRPIPTGARFCPNCGTAVPRQGPSAQILVNQEVDRVEGGQVTGVDIRQVIGNVFVGSTGEEQAIQRRNLRKLMKKVKDFWVSGVLERSVQGAVLVELRKQYQPQAVNNPLQQLAQTAEPAEGTFTSDEKIIEIFDRMENALLILDGVGSGKTTTLLELARDSIQQAEQDPLEPVPVVLNLASWNHSGQQLSDWVVKELNEIYKIPMEMGRQWLENNNLALLLDGLDEVSPELRTACITALNQFRKDFGLTQVAVCSRRSDYEASSVRLDLSGAVLLQPLTTKQVDQYMQAAGQRLQSLQQVLREDRDMQTLAQSPLMLNIMRLAYQDISASTLAEEQFDTLQERRKYLLDVYVERMFQVNEVQTPGSRQAHFERQKMLGWLGWLAQRMRQNNLSVFLIEQLQPDWLSTKVQRWFYWLASRTIVGLLIGLLVGGTAEVGGTPNGRFVYVLASMLAGLAIGLVDGLLYERRDPESQRQLLKPGWAWMPGYPLGVGLLAGLIFWLFFTLVAPIGLDALRIASGMALVYGLLFGLSSSLRKGWGDVQPAEALMWSWLEARKGLLPAALVAVATLGVIGAIFATSNPLQVWLLFGLVYALLGGLAVFLIFGLRGRQVETKSFPNQGTWLSARNALRAGLPLGVLAWLVYGLFYGLLPGLTVGVRFGLLSALWYGGYAVIKHAVLRLGLYFSRSVPWNLAEFLDYAAGLKFMNKVGGGYVFTNRLLQAYFEEFVTPGK